MDWREGSWLLYELVVRVTVIGEKQEGGIVSLEPSKSKSFFM